jgi:preprotein translocase subunit SecG
MFGLFLGLLLLDGLLLAVVVLLQSGKGDGLAGMGGSMATDSVIGGRQAATILTKATWTTGSLFLIFSLVLAIMSSRQQRPSSILREEFKPKAAQPAPSNSVVPGTQPAQTQPAGTKPPQTNPAPTNQAPPKR